MVVVPEDLPETVYQVRLKEWTADRVLDVHIGPAEAHAIGFGLQGKTTPRPMTHDFIKDLLDARDDVVAVRVILTNVEHEAFFAELDLRHGDRPVSVDCRPSDGIAVAIRLGIPIFATTELDRYFAAA